eukprot:1196176-Prorocentrum_minimum.AAC.1
MQHSGAHVATVCRSARWLPTQAGKPDARARRSYKWGGSTVRRGRRHGLRGWIQARPKGVDSTPQGVDSRPQGMVWSSEDAGTASGGGLEHLRGWIQGHRGWIGTPQGVDSRPQGVVWSSEDAGTASGGGLNASGGGLNGSEGGLNASGGGFKATGDGLVERGRRRGLRGWFRRLRGWIQRLRGWIQGHRGWFGRARTPARPHPHRLQTANRVVHRMIRGDALEPQL